MHEVFQSAGGRLDVDGTRPTGNPVPMGSPELMGAMLDRIASEAAVLQQLLGKAIAAGGDADLEHAAQRLARLIGYMAEFALRPVQTSVGGVCGQAPEWFELPVEPLATGVAGVRHG